MDRELMAVLLRLPARQRLVVALRLFLDLDTAETAIRELKDLPALPATINAAGARVTIKAAKAVPGANACSVKEAYPYRDFRYEGYDNGKYFFILYPAKILPGTLLEITVSPGIKLPAGAPSPQPLTPATATPSPTPNVFFTNVRDVPSCTS